jgi:hypothetical protein
MNSVCPRATFSRLGLAFLRGAALAAVAALTPASFAQVQANTIPVKNWAVPKAGAQTLGDQSQAAAGTTPGLVFIAITPCRVMDTRSQGGSGETGPFGPPSLVAGQARVVPVPSSNCGVPVAAAYSMNLAGKPKFGVGFDCKDLRQQRDGIKRDGQSSPARDRGPVVG